MCVCASERASQAERGRRIEDIVAKYNIWWKGGSLHTHKHTFIQTDNTTHTHTHTFTLYEHLKPCISLSLMRIDRLQSLCHCQSLLDLVWTWKHRHTHTDTHTDTHRHTTVCTRCTRTSACEIDGLFYSATPTSMSSLHLTRGIYQGERMTARVLIVNHQQHYWTPPPPPPPSSPANMDLFWEAEGAWYKYIP